MISRLCRVANTERMGKVWQTLPFHLWLNENKTRQLLITNNREMSQEESYPIKTSPVNPAGRLAEPGKCLTFCTLLKQAYLNCIKFKVPDETCNSSWVLILISKIEDKYVSIIKNHLPNYVFSNLFFIYLYYLVS